MTALVPISDIERMATAVAKSGLFGIKTSEQGVALMLIAQAEGLHPAIAARDYHVIQGRPALKTDAMLARFQQAGGKVIWKTYTDDEVTGTFSHPAGGELTVTWTLAQAKRIGLAGKDNWKSYPRAMLRARCVSEGIRSVFPGCVVGVYTPEEVEDFSPTPPAPAKASKDLEVVEEVKPGTIPLFIPGDTEPYSLHSDMQEWKQNLLALVKKINGSAKLKLEHKQEKMQELRKVNAELLNSLSTEERISLRAELAAAGMVAEVPKEQPSVETQTSESAS